MTSIWLKQKKKSEKNLQKLTSTEIKAKVSLQIALFSLLGQYPGSTAAIPSNCNPLSETHTSFTYISFTYCSRRNLMMRKTICICFPITCKVWCLVVALIIVLNTMYRRSNNNIEHITFFFLITETILMSVETENLHSTLDVLLKHCSNPCLSLHINEIINKVNK